MARRLMNGNHVVCLTNRGYGASLTVAKVYRRLRDAGAERRGFVRVVDDTGEDYLFPAEMFFVIHLPPGASRALRAAS